MQKMIREKGHKWQLLGIILAVMLMIFAGCEQAGEPQTDTDQPQAGVEDHSGDIYILYTSDIHCGVEKGFGLVGLQQIRETVDAARAEGADYVYLLAHLGMNSASDPWTYDDVISNVSGIDVVLDGHSHDTEQVVMKDKDGKSVVRSACGTKLEAVGYSLMHSFQQQQVAC